MNHKQIWKRCLLTGVITAFLGAGTNIIDMPMAAAKISFDVFDFEGHRGARAARPENTLSSFAYAMEMGVTTIELDIHLTKDGRLVISHDPILSSILTKGPDGQYVKTGAYDLRKMTLKEIRQFDVGTMNPAAGNYYELHGKTQISVPGSKIPTLEELFELANAYGNDKIFFNIEVKSFPDPLDPRSADTPDPVVITKAANEIIKKYNMEDRVIYQSFDWRVVKAMKELNPNITLSALHSEQESWGRLTGCTLKIGEKEPSPWLAGININDYNGNYVRAAHALGVDIVAPYWEELSPQLVNEAHKLGMRVVPWTVNDPKAMNMLIDMNVDGIISDKPWILRKILLDRGIELRDPVINTASPHHTGTAINEIAPALATSSSDSAS